MTLKDFTGSYGRKLSGGTPTQVSETVVKLKLSLGDLNAIKAIRQVAVSKATTFLHVDHGAFTDGNENKVVKAYKIVSTFDDDKVSPTLDAFDLNMDSRQLALRFSETVDGSTYTHSGITLHSNDGTAGKAVSLTLGAGSKIVQAIDSATLVIQLDKGDTDAIKNIPGFCNSKATVFVSITDKFMKDTNKKLIDAIPSTKALPATKYTFDETDAAVTTFSFNLHTKTLTMNFDEPVDATNVNVTSLVFQSQKNATDSKYKLTGSKNVTRSKDGLRVVITLTDKDANAIKADDKLLEKAASTYLSLSADFIVDMATNDIAGIASSDAKLVAQFVDDSKKPSLLEFDIDMNQETLTLSFSETMDETTLVPKAITLQQTQGAKLNLRHQLTTSKVTTTSPGLVLKIKRSLADMHILKQKEIASTKDKVFLSFAATGAKDMGGINGNSANALLKRHF